MLMVLMLRLNLFLFVNCLISVWHKNPPGPPEVPHRLPLQPTLYQISLKSLAPQRLRGERISPFSTDDIINQTWNISFITFASFVIESNWRTATCVSLSSTPLSMILNLGSCHVNGEIFCVSVYLYIFINIDFYSIIQVESHSERPHNSPVSGNKLECL